MDTAASQDQEDTIRVLLYEPDLDHGYAVAEAMVGSQDVFELAHVDSLEQVLEQLEAAPMDVALIDLEGLEGYVEGALLRIVSISPATSIVLICEPAHEEQAMQGVRYGAHDYVIRDEQQTDSLLRTLRSSMGRHKSKTNLHFLAHHDALTGLANRVLFARCLEGAVRKSAELGHAMGVLYLDLDGFKPVNDRLGHDSGDRLLQIISRRLRSSVHRSDVVARMGGDEFAILLEHLPSEDAAQRVAHRLVAAVQEPVHLGCQVAQVSCSVGVATARGGSGADELLKSSDEAMYRAKRIGGGGIWVVGEEAPPSGLELSGALQRGEFELYYQPQVDQERRLFGVEALLRWRRSGELIGPNTFVPQLEESGLIVPVGDWVLRTALEQLLVWRSDGQRVPRVAVNVSPLQLQRSDFAIRILGLLRELGLPGNALEIEVTERVVLSDDGPSRDNLERLGSLGVAVALDDFGTGYSSLAYLHRHPIDTLKVDRSFVQDIETNPRSFAIVGSILDLGRRFGIVTVAEGVETTEQARILCEEGCNVLQGFLFGRPQPGANPPTPARG